MVDFLITAEDLRAAPQPVREWLAAQLFAAPDSAASAPVQSTEQHQTTLAALSTDEATRMLEVLRSDYLACQVFFELGREGGDYALQRPAAHRLALADIIRHTRLADLDHLAACLDSITAAFREVRDDPAAMLFAVDQRGGLYVHEGTRKAIKSLWQAIVTTQLSDIPHSHTIPDGPSMPLRGMAAE